MKIKYLIPLVVLLVLGALGLMGYRPSDSSSLGAVNPDTTTMPSGHFVSKTLLNAATTSATSTGTLRIAGAKKVNAYFSRAYGGGNSGSSLFTIEVTPDGDNWYAFNKLLGSDVSSTATSSVTIAAATTTVMVAMDLDHDAFYALRCKVVETTDGTHTCAVTAEY